jgi:hypothetical protein
VGTQAVALRLDMNPNWPDYEIGTAEIGGFAKMRVLLAGILGGIAMYVWATLAHVATPLAAVGVGPLPGGAATLADLRRATGDRPGLYVFPSMQSSASGGAARAATSANFGAQPHGLLVYAPSGADGISPRQLITEFALELVESILLALVLAAPALAGFGRKVGAAAAVGAIAGLATNFSYWNWYGFPLDYTLANAFIELMKFVFAGAAIAAFLGWRTRRTT